MPRFSLFILILLAPVFLFAQGNKTTRDSMRRVRNTIDTNYIRKFPDRFIVTLSQSYRQYDIRVNQTISEDTGIFANPQWIADANASSGISVDFDKISFSFGYKTVPPTEDVIRKKGLTEYTSFGLSFGFYRFRVETSYRNYHGFYDYKTANYDTGFASTGIYHQNPTMNVRSLRAKTIFIFNKKHFSYNAAFYNTARQLKSAHSLLLVNNIYGYRISADSSLFPKPAQPFYQTLDDLNVFNVVGISVGPGYSANLVIWHTLYFNTTFTTLFDFQRRYYKTLSGDFESKYWHVGFAGDARFALGLNGKRLFTSITFRMDVNSYLGNGMRINPRFKSLDFNLGYRFKYRERQWMKKMKSNKWYQLL